MGPDGLAQQIKSGTLEGIYFMSGAEDYLKSHYIARMRKALVAEGSDALNYQRVAYRQAEDVALADYARALPVFSDKKLLLIDLFDNDAPRAEIDAALKGIFDTLPDCCIIIFNEQRTDADTKKNLLSSLSKLAGSRGVSVEFKYQSETALLDWIRRHAQAAGLEIEASVARYLLSITDNGMLNLAGELEKIFAHATGGNVTEGDIDAVCVKTVDAKIYELTDALLRRDKSAVKTLTDELLEKNPDVVVLGAVYGAFERLYRVALARDAGMTQNQIADKLGMKPFVVKKNLSILNGVTVEQTRRMIDRCRAMDARMKRFARDKTLTLEVFMLEMMNLL